MASAPVLPRSPSRPILTAVPPGMAVVASARDAGWKSVQGTILEGRLDGVHYHSAPYSVVSFLLKGATRVEWKRGRREAKFFAEPGSLAIIPAGDDNYFRTDRWTESLHFCIDPDWLAALAEEEWKPRGSTIELMDVGNRRDAELWNLGQRLAALIRAPIVGARLYAEALQTQIGIQLLWNYSSLPRPRQTPDERLCDPRLRRVIDFIHGSLGGEVTLAGLAEVAGLSPNYFLGAFKQATGRTPHRYLTEQRVARACTLLEDPHRSITEVAVEVGFSSQSHLTVVFRRFMKTTPASFRDNVLGNFAEAPPPRIPNPTKALATPPAAE